jgi:Ca-activated chloride channel family protein
MSSLTFAHSLMLVVAGIFVCLAAWGIAWERRRQLRTLARFGDESLFASSSTLPSRRARIGGKALQVSAVALGLVALARPQLGERPASLAHTGRDVLVLLDLSRSMNAADDSTSRLLVAKQAISQVLARAPEHRAGLIVFGGSAFLQLPLTGNHGAFLRFLEAATTDDLGDPTTNLAAALFAAATVFEHEGERGYQSILVASDGESMGGDLNPALGRLKEAGIPVFSIGIGSTEGAPVPADSTDAPEKWHRDHIGRVVISRLEEGDLRRTALETGGAYTLATAAGVQNLAAELARREKRVLSARESTERIDRFQWPLALALVTLSLVPVASVKRKRT